MRDEDMPREQLLAELRAVRGRAHGLGLNTDRLPLAYILMNAELLVTAWNPAAERIFGYTAAEAIGRMIYDVVLAPPVSEQVQDVIRRLQAGDMHAHSVNENRTKDGRTIVCEWFNTPLMDPGGGFSGIFSLTQDITERINAEKKLREYYDRVQALSRQLLTVQEEERRRLARELHDEVGQILTSLKFSLGPNGARLSEAQALVAEAMTRVREISFDLRPALLDHLGLLPALSALIDRYSGFTGVRVNFRHAGLERRFRPEVETAAYRIVQEALTNAARHAKVAEVAVRLWVNAGALEVQVEDAGAGFDPDAVLAAGASSGLPGMVERATLLGGRLTVDSVPGGGTHLHAELPAGDTVPEDAK